MNPATHYKDRRDGLWYKCKACDEFVFKQVLERNLYICPACNYYFPVPAENRLRHILSPDSCTNLFPTSAPLSLLQSIKLTDLVSQSVFSDSSYRLIAAGEGEISGYPAILTVVHPFARPQRLHFISLLIAIRAAAQRALPLITVYSNDSLPKSRATDRPIQSELSFPEITYLSTEMEQLSEASLPQITVLTDTNVGALSTKFPLGDLVLAERENGHTDRASEQSHASDTRTHSGSLLDEPKCDVFIDRYIPRQDLSATLGKLLGFFAKT